MNRALTIGLGTAALGYTLNHFWQGSKTDKLSKPALWLVAGFISYLVSTMLMPAPCSLSHSPAVICPACPAPKLCPTPKPCPPPASCPIPSLVACPIPSPCPSPSCPPQTICPPCQTTTISSNTSSAAPVSFGSMGGRVLEL